MSYRRGNFPGFNVKPANYSPPVVTMRPMPADEVALIRQKMELWRGVEKKDAPGIRDSIQAQIGGFPESLEAHLLLAEASYDAEEYDAAEAAAAKAVALDPKSVRGWLYRGMAATKKAEADPDAAPALADQAREHFAEAARLEPDDPRPLIGFYRTFFELGLDPPEQALIALETAFEHAGSDAEYRYLLTRQLLTEGRFADARTVILPAAFDGHATGEADADEDDPTPRRLLNAIDAEEAENAIEMIDKMLEPEDEDD